MRTVNITRWLVPLAAAVAAAAAVASPGVARAAICGHSGKSTIRHVVVISFENHSYAQVLGRSAPRSEFKTLASSCGSATRFRAAHVPRSLPNYIAATSGAVSISGDCVPGPGCWSHTRSIFGQIGRRNWRVWAESMPGRCVAQNRGEYVSRHAPAIYFTRIRRSTCRADMTRLPGMTPRPTRKFTWIAPNLMHDMHDGSPAQASRWLRHFLSGPRGLLRTRSYQQGHTAIFIWFDTGDGSAGLTTPIPMIVLGKHVPHRRFTQPMTDYALLHTWERIFHLHCLNRACSARSLVSGFHL